MRNIDQRVDSILRQSETITVPPRKTVIRPIVNKFGRQAISAAKAEYFKNILVALFGELYAELSTGQHWHLDWDGRVLEQYIKMPWSERGRMEWGLKPTDAKAISHYMTGVEDGPLYFHTDTCWYVNLRSYPTFDSAIEWVDKSPIDGEFWVKLMDRFQDHVKSRAEPAQNPHKRRANGRAEPAQNPRIPATVGQKQEAEV